MTTNEANALAGVERAMALDELDASGVDYLAEDEAGIFVDEDDDREPDYEPDFDYIPGYMYSRHFEG